MRPVEQRTRRAPELPGYTYLQHIGSGGNAEVYLYEQDITKLKVAVKVLEIDGLDSDVERHFTAEANVMARLAGHPFIAAVMQAAVTADGRPYIVMKHYPRPNLGVRARREGFSVADVLRIGIKVGSAVETAHGAGILHRDIKPANILTDQYGEPALTDFGIAATIADAASAADGMSVPWSPPEVLSGATDGDPRADVYSLGATLWHLLAGRSPYEVPGGDNSHLTIMRRVQQGPVPAVPRADVPESLQRLLRQALATSPLGRPQSALALVRGLQAVEQEQRLPLTPIVVPDVEPPAMLVSDELDEEHPTVTRGARAAGTGPEDAPTTSRGTPPAGSTPAGETAAMARRRAPAPPPPPLDRTVKRPPQPPLAEPPHDGADAVPTQRHGAARARAAFGVSAAVILVAAGLLSRPHRANPVAAAEPDPASTSDAISPVAPGEPKVTAHRIDATHVEFTWTYADGMTGDRFRWKSTRARTTPASGTETDARAQVTAAKGARVCVVVTVFRAAGGTGSPPSSEVCA